VEDILSAASEPWEGGTLIFALNERRQMIALALVGMAVLIIMTVDVSAK